MEIKRHTVVPVPPMFAATDGKQFINHDEACQYQARLDYDIAIDKFVKELYPIHEDRYYGNRDRDEYNKRWAISNFLQNHNVAVHEFLTEMYKTMPVDFKGKNK